MSLEAYPTALQSGERGAMGWDLYNQRRAFVNYLFSISVPVSLSYEPRFHYVLQPATRTEAFAKMRMIKVEAGIERRG